MECCQCRSNLPIRWIGQNQSQKDLKRVFTGIHFTFLTAAAVLSCRRDGGGIAVNRTGVAATAKRMAWRAYTI
jgi:hypothetical protein